MNSAKWSTLHVSRWNELRSSPTALFQPRHSIDCSVEWPLRHKDLYSPVRECQSMCLSNLWLAHAPTLHNDPALLTKPYKYSSPQGSRIQSRSGAHRIGIPLTRSRDLRLSSPGHPLPLGSVQIPSTIFNSNWCLSYHSFRRLRWPVVTRNRDSK